MDEECADSACVSRVLNGGRDAYNEIVSRYQTRLFALLLMLIRVRFCEEEVTQVEFLRAYTNLRSYDLNRPFYPWLATIAVRLATNWINRTGARQQRSTSDFDITKLPTPVPSPAEELEKHQVERDLWTHVADLPQGERTAVLMFYKQELSVSDIAGILGVTQGTIKTFLHRGRSHLRTRIESTGDMQ